MVDNKYGLEPEEWADLKTNYPEYYKNIVIENQQSGGSSGGSSSGVMIVEATNSDGTTTATLNKTWKEIHDAFVAGTTVLVHHTVIDEYQGVTTEIDCISLINNINSSNGEYHVYFHEFVNMMDCSTDTETGYPSGTFV